MSTEIALAYADVSNSNEINTNDNNHFSSFTGFYDFLVVVTIKSNPVSFLKFAFLATSRDFRVQFFWFVTWNIHTVFCIHIFFFCIFLLDLMLPWLLLGNIISLLFIADFLSSSR